MSTRTAALPYVGVDALVELTPPAGGTTITLKNMNWSIQPKSMIKEAPNTSDGMVRAPGLTDFAGKVAGHTDVTSATTPIEANVMPGMIFDFKMYRSKGSNKYFSGTIIIGEDLSIEAGVDQTEDWNFSFAKAYGFLVLPNGTTF